MSRSRHNSAYNERCPRGNRLTEDAGAQRLDLAGAATEVEREWLYRLLAKRYALSVPAGPGRG